MSGYHLTKRSWTRHHVENSCNIHRDEEQTFIYTVHRHTHTYMCMYMIIRISRQLYKARQQATQLNSPEEVFFCRGKLVASGGIRTHSLYRQHMCDQSTIWTPSAVPSVDSVSLLETPGNSIICTSPPIKLQRQLS